MPTIKGFHVNKKPMSEQKSKNKYQQGYEIYYDLTQKIHNNFIFIFVNI